MTRRVQQNPPELKPREVFNLSLIDKILKKKKRTAKKQKILSTYSKCNYFRGLVSLCMWKTCDLLSQNPLGKPTDWRSPDLCLNRGCIVHNQFVKHRWWWKVSAFHYFVNQHAADLLKMLLNKTIMDVSMCLLHELLHLSHMQQANRFPALGDD